MRSSAAKTAMHTATPPRGLCLLRFRLVPHRLHFQKDGFPRALGYKPLWKCINALLPVSRLMFGMLVGHLFSCV